MKKSLLIRYTTAEKVLALLKSNGHNIAELPAMIDAISQLEKCIEHVKSLLNKIEQIPSQTAGEKTSARTCLTALTIKTGKILKVYAFVNKDESLADFVISSENMLNNQMKHQDVLGYAKKLHQQLKSNSEKLLDFGLKEKMLDRLEAEINKYSKLMNEPQKLIAQRKSTNKELDEKINSTYSLLTNQIDPLVELCSDDKEFYKLYKSTRALNNANPPNTAVKNKT